MTGELAALDRQMQQLTTELRDAALSTTGVALRDYVTRIDALTVRLIEIRAALVAMEELSTGQPMSAAWVADLQAAIDKVRLS